MNAFNVDVDTIVSICAIGISIISLVFSIIFSRKQMEHNKNSVRPISAIKVMDYEDKLCVRIDNVGTGPLIINSFRVKNNEIESYDLISIMPRIDEYQFWSTFACRIDGNTIPVGGSINLLELRPTSDKVRKMVREALSKITVYLEYSDIYSTNFHDEKALDFFGRHNFK